eukprot:SAG25_NODE_2006_length_2037_cov_1.496388_2_plen_75_part_01
MATSAPTAPSSTTRGSDARATRPRTRAPDPADASARPAPTTGSPHRTSSSSAAVTVATHGPAPTSCCTCRLLTKF